MEALRPRSPQPIKQPRLFVGDVPFAGEGAVVVGDVLGGLVGGGVPVVGFEGGGPLDDEGAVVGLEVVENLERVVVGSADVWTTAGGGGDERGFLVGAGEAGGGVLD